MYNFSKEAKERIDNNKIIKCYLKVLATDTKPEIIIDQNNYLKDLKFEDLRYVPNEGFIGQTVAKRVTGNLNGINIENREFELYLGVEMENGKDEYQKYGNFIVQKPKNNQINNNNKFEALDYMVKLNLPWENTITYPCTLKQLFDNLVTQTGLKTKVTSFLNQDFILENNQFEPGTTKRQVLKAIAQMAFSWARIDEDNEIVMDFKVKDTIEEELTIDDYLSFENQNEYGPVNVIVLRNSQVEGENFTIRDEESIKKYGENELVISDNPFAYTQDKREKLIQAGKSLFGLKYTPCKIKSKGYIYLNCKDNIRINNLKGEKFDTYLFNHIIDYNGIVLDSIESVALTKTETKYQFTAPMKQNTRRTEILVDKANQKILETIEKVDGQDKKILNIEKNVDGISTKLTETTQKTEKIEKDVANNQASFEDFRDNEYIKSIGNLQSQIDGAIQFWNGSEIPTLNNYPANEWTTEDEKNNHRADIYTVIKDVQGELKQGKGYRFDKIGNEWKWIELTDNELSAIQAIANEANNRSKVNQGNIKTLEDKSVQVDLTINGIKTQISNNETKVTELSDSVQKLNVNLETNNIVISVNSNNLPFNNANYDIVFSCTFLGKPIQIVPQTTSKNSGIEVAISNSKITFSVKNSVAIPKLDNIYKFNFTYEGLTLTKAIVISLAKQGNKGTDGKNGTNGTNGQPGKDGTQGPRGEQGPKGDKGIGGTYTSKNAYPPNNCLDYASRKKTVYWLQSDIIETKGEEWNKPGTVIVFIIPCTNGDTYVCYQKIHDFNNLLPQSYWINKKGVNGQNGTNGINGKDGKDAAIQSTTPPKDTTQMWYDINTNTLKRWNGTIWEVVNDFSDDIKDINNNLTNNYYTKTQTNSKIDQTDNKITQEINRVETNVNGQIKIQNEKMSKIEQDYNSISSQIKDIADITEVKESKNGILEFKSVNESEPININIKPISGSISYLYPNNNLFPSNNLYPKGRTLKFTNITDGKKVYYELPNDLLYLNSSVYDEFVLDYDLRVCKIIQRTDYDSNGNIYKLSKENIINYSYPKINLTNGDYKIELLGYNSVFMQIRVMSQNIYTTQFATKAEVSSNIEQKANEINLEVSKKVGDDEVVSKINQSSEKIQIDANKISLKRKDNKFNRR